MKINWKVLIVFGVVIIFGSIWIYNNENRIIGGDVDEHGCLVAAGYSWNENEKECVREWIKDGKERYQDRIYCTDEQRNSDMCMFLYEPVCGFPDEKTYSNSCVACSDKEVEYWKHGECAN